MKVEVWSDYVCPFCYIGKRRLEEALEKSGLASQTEVVYKSYQLDPNTPVASDRPLVESTAKKMQVSVAQAEQMMQGLAEQAKTAGLTFRPDIMKTCNTFDAHRLAKYAEVNGKGKQVTERLLRGYFTEGERIDTEEVLLNIAEEAGLDRAETKSVLQSDQYADAVKGDQEEARQIGVQGVPFFVLNRKYALSGAQPAEVFIEALEKVAEEEGVRPSLQVLDGGKGGKCEDGSCDV